MDHYHDDSDSDKDSFTLEIERGDAVIVYGCNERRDIPPVNHVTKVLIGPKDHSRCVSEMTGFTNDLSSEASGSAHHERSSPFGPFEDHGPKTQAVCKQYQELAEALSHLTVKSEQGEANTSQGLNPESLGLSRKFRYSNRSEVSPICQNPFLVDANTSNLVLPTSGSLGDFPGASNSANAFTGSNSGKAQTQSDITPAPMSGGSGSNPPGALQSPDLIGREPTSAESANYQSGSLNASQAAETVDTKAPDGSVNFRTIPPDITMQCHRSNSSSSESAHPAVSNATSPSPIPQPSLEETKVHVLSTAYSQELPAIQESLNTPDKPESSFHFPEPPRCPPLVCVPVKEVKFEEASKHQVVTVQEHVTEALGQVIPITVQQCHTTNASVPNEVGIPTCSASQVQSKAKDVSNVTQTISNSVTESKMNVVKHGDIQIPSVPPDHEANEHSYGIIGNDDNLSEITLPALADSANQRDHDVGPYNNGHPRPRIRISIDQQSTNSSDRTTAIAGIAVTVLLVSIIILLAVYKLFNRSSPN